jgi:hypothetical protein
MARRSTSIDFAENQLFPGLIGLSPLAAAHPRLFQQAWVRPSSGCYPTFSLAAARSPGFGSHAGDCGRGCPRRAPCSDSLSLRLRLAAQARRRRELADPLYKRYAVTRPLARTGLRLLVGVRFQVCFTPLIGVLFTFPSRYWCAIGRQGVFRLGGWSPHVRAGFHVPRPTRGSTGALRLRGCHPLRRAVPGASASLRWTTGLLRVRSPLLPESRLMSSPPGTEMFQFPGFASARYGFTGGYP